MSQELNDFIKKELKELHKQTILENKLKKIEENIGVLEEQKKWIQKAFAKKEGSLHKALDVPEDKKIPVAKMKQALKNPKLRKKALAAINANKDVYGSLVDTAVYKGDKE